MSANEDLDLAKKEMGLRMIGITQMKNLET